MYVCMYVRACMYVCVCVCSFDIYIYIYIYIYLFICYFFPCTCYFLCISSRYLHTDGSRAHALTKFTLHQQLLLELLDLEALFVILTGAAIWDLDAAGAEEGQVTETYKQIVFSLNRSKEKIQ